MQGTGRGEGNFIVWQIKYFKRYLKETLFPNLDYPNAPLPDHFKPNKLIGFSLISTLGFIVTFFLVRVIHNLIFSIFLRVNNINHTYSLLNIDFHVGKISNWTEGKLLFINTIPYVVFLLSGVLLPNMVKKLRSWQVRLITTWLAFNLVLFFLSHLIQGVILYDELGVALAWFFAGIAIRIIVVLLFVFLIMVGIKKFGFYFLLSAPHFDFTDDYKHIRSWFTYSILIPFFIGYTGIVMAADSSTYLEYFITLAVGFFAIYLVFQTVLVIYVSGISTEEPYSISPIITITVILLVILTINILKTFMFINYVHLS